MLAERRIAIHQASALGVMLVHPAHELGFVEADARAGVLWVVPLPRRKRVQKKGVPCE